MWTGKGGGEMKGGREGGKGGRERIRKEKKKKRNGSRGEQPHFLSQAHKNNAISKNNNNNNKCIGKHAQQPELSRPQSEHPTPPTRISLHGHCHRFLLLPAFVDREIKRYQSDKIGPKRYQVTPRSRVRRPHDPPSP